MVSRAKALSAETYGKIFITPIQVTEVYSGMTGNEKIKTKELIESFYMLDINKQIGELAGEYMQKFRKSHNIELADAIIGTTAKNLQF
ncbi:MAG: PIN domain-containing protein [Deltaproteobacteria bacterium]|nr:PIN domain-containing protein [Deltaproteobacteria bacterium]